VRTHCVAIRAYEFTLRDLLEYAFPIATPGKEGQVCGLGVTRYVIPLHRRWMKLLAAVRARTSSL
jgi:hypothetical protein